jgi:hypothetical protein
MSYQLVNETLLIVDQEINDFLMDFPQDHPFQMALSLPLFRQKLTAKILSKIPNRHKIYCNEWSKKISADCFLGLAKERSLITQAIRKIMPTMINELQQPQSISPVRRPLAGGSTFHVHELAWWLKIHTIIPCVTYYFGPFESSKEAKEYYPEYVEDLKHEKAIGISGRLQKTQPTFLTVMDAPSDLKRDEQYLWHMLKQKSRQYTAALESWQNLWNVLPGSFLVVNFDGTLKQANMRACQLLQTSQTELQGRSLLQYVPPSQVGELERRLVTMARDQSVWPVAYRWSMQLQVSAPNVIPVVVEATQQQDAAGKVMGWYWLLHDVTPPPFSHHPGLRKAGLGVEGIG